MQEVPVLQRVWLSLLAAVVRPSHLAVVLVINLVAYVCAFVSKWALAWLAAALFLPDTLLPNASAVQTTSQVLPALMVSVFVFIVGSLFVVTQQATTIHSNRAGLLLLYDARVQTAVVRPLLISVATLLLALLTPADDVSGAVAALSLILVFATAATLVASASLLPYLLNRVTAPRNFALYALQGVEGLLSVNATGLVVYRVGLLGEMLKRGVRTGDSLQIREALNGLEGFHQAYLAAAAANPSARIHEYDGGAATGWLAEEMVSALVSAGQEAIGADIANEDTVSIARALAGFGQRSAEAKHLEEFRRAVDGLAELATCTQQMKIPGMANVFSEPAFGLAALVGASSGQDERAAALATWGLSIAYAVRHLHSPGHVHWEKSLAAFGGRAPFDEAHSVVDSHSFASKWANKLAGIWPLFDEDGSETAPGASDAVHGVLASAESEIAVGSDATS